MDLMQLRSRFPDQESCITFLEDARWADLPVCPHCGAQDVGRKADGRRTGRWNCHRCKSSFNVLSGTVFQGSRVKLPLWFEAILLLNRSGHYQSARRFADELGLNVKTAWYLHARVRKGLESDDPLFQAICNACSDSKLLDRASTMRR